jgi:hypothetical protein
VRGQFDQVCMVREQNYLMALSELRDRAQRQRCLTVVRCHQMRIVFDILLLLSVESSVNIVLDS